MAYGTLLIKVRTKSYSNQSLLSSRFFLVFSCESTRSKEVVNLFLKLSILATTSEIFTIDCQKHSLPQPDMLPVCVLFASVMLPPIVMLSWAKTGAAVTEARPTTTAKPNAATIAIATNNIFEFIDRG